MTPFLLKVPRRLNTALAVARQVAAGRPGLGISPGTGTFLGVLVVARARADPRARPQPSLTDSPASTAPALRPGGASGPTRAIAAPEGYLGAARERPRATKGLAADDVIVRAAGRTAPSPGALGSIVAGCEPGTGLLVTWVDLG